MSYKPKIFVSAVTKELGEARELVARTLRMLDFEPVFQEEFTAATGVVRAVLDKNLEPCAAVIQLVGFRYGWDVHDAPDPSQAMSYTHYEARYAHLKTRPIWYLVIGSACTPDNPNDEDDEKKMLQTAYRIRVSGTKHLWYAVEDRKDVELTVYRMLKELDALRPDRLRWVRDPAKVADDSAGQPAHPSQAALTAPEAEQMMRGLLSEFVPALQKARQGKNPDEQERGEENLYARLGAVLGMTTAQAQAEIEALARERAKDRTASPMERAQAAFALKQYADAEKLALEAEKTGAGHDPAAFVHRIQALRLAGAAACERVDYVRARQHFESAAALTDKESDLLEWADVQNELAWLLLLDGKYPEQETLAHCVWDACRLAEKGEEPIGLVARHRWALALNTIGKSKQAEHEYRELIPIRERVLGAEHPDTLSSRNNLALVLHVQGKYAGAEEENRARIKIEERVLGAEHPDTLASRNNLANALRAQGKYAEAEQEHRAVLKIKERVLGAGHPGTLMSRMNLANALRAQGKYAEAEQEYRAVLPIQKRVLGADHPDTLKSCYNLALCLEDQKKLKEALEFMQRAETGRVKVLGAGHPDSKDAKHHRERIEAALKE